MELTELITLLIVFIQKWLGTTLPRILSALGGTLLCVLAVTAFWDRKLKTVGATIGFSIGLVMIVFALDPSLPYAFAKFSFLVRIRAIMVFLSFVVVVITIEAIRRSHLQERYALLWVTTGLIILMVAFFPGILDFFTMVIGTRYITSVVGIIFTFLLLIAFHFSIALSTAYKNQTQIAQRCAILEERIRRVEKRLDASHPAKIMGFPCVAAAPEPAGGIRDTGSDKPLEHARRIRGAQAAAPLIIVFTVAAVLAVGLMAPRPMVGDEVSHYHMLKEQAADLSRPNLKVPVPNGWGKVDVSVYAFPFLWHYFGALLYRLSGERFLSIQVYQSLFLVQLLVVAFLMAKSRRGIETRSVIVYLLAMASLPLTLLFSVTFYLDVPVTAQVLTAFYLLDRRKNLWAVCFISLGIGMKISALLFLPAFFGLMAAREFRTRPIGKGLMTLALSVLLVAGFTWTMGKVIKERGYGSFYPEEKLQQWVDAIKRAVPDKPATRKNGVPHGRSASSGGPEQMEWDANRPGNLKTPVNYVVYGGVVFWLVVLLWAAALVLQRRTRGTRTVDTGPSAWLWATGLSYLVLTAIFLRHAPDARFFLPGLPFVLLPMIERIVRLPMPKLIIALLTSVAILQSGYVLAKTYRLRQIPPGLAAAIAYLRQTPPDPPRVFMYPEGNYRLFPVPHEWYFNWRLRDFWKAGNDERIRTLHQFRVGAVVIKKHLVTQTDSDLINLGVYPELFIDDLNADPRFEKVFENDMVIIYKVPDRGQPPQGLKKTGNAPFVFRRCPHTVDIFHEASTDFKADLCRYGLLSEEKA